MTAQEVQQEAFSRAVSSPSMTNYPAIFQGFEAKGISADEIRPRENVFTFNAWKALGRKVKKGEHGVKVVTMAPTTRKETDKATGETKTTTGRRPWHTTVFHISQTEPEKATS